MRYKSTKDFPLYINSKLILQPWEVIEIDNQDLTNDLLKIINQGWLQVVVSEPEKEQQQEVLDTEGSDIVYNKIEPINRIALHKTKIQPQLIEEFVKADDEENDSAEVLQLSRKQKSKTSNTRPKKSS